MRIITGTISSTPLHWLPILSHIAPPYLRRQHILKREYTKIMSNDELPIHNDINLNCQQRLKSRSSPLINSMHLTDNFNINDKWLEEWSENAPPEWLSIKNIDPNEKTIRI